MAEDDPPDTRRVSISKARHPALNPEIIPPEYIDTLRQIQEEQKRVQLEKAQDRIDRVQDQRDRRLFRRNAALALGMALAFNNPAGWMKGLYEWFMAHVFSFR